MARNKNVRPLQFGPTKEALAKSTLNPEKAIHHSEFEVGKEYILYQEDSVRRAFLTYVGCLVNHAFSDGPDTDHFRILSLHNYGATWYCTECQI